MTETYRTGRRATGAFVVAALLALTLPLAGFADGGVHYEVVVTNLTRGQVMSPAVVATHTNRLEPLFVTGAPASDEVALVAEDAMNGSLIAALEGSRQVAAVGLATFAGGPIPPGESGSVVLAAPGRFRFVSLVGMLVTTNDAFYGLTDARGPAHGMRVWLSPAYDAGTESNNEECAFIPGPPCGNGGRRDTTAAEGYVHVHAGVHGGASLDPAQHDWRNPVAKITVIRHGEDDD